MIKFIFSVALLAAFSVCAAEKPADYAYGMALDVDGSEALYEITLPAAVYRGVARADLADVRVFNGAGELVPHGWRPRRTSGLDAPKPVMLTLFPLRAPAGVSLDGLSISVRRGPDGASRVQVTSTDTRATDARSSGASRTAGYLVDLTVLDRPLRALELDWASGPEGYAGKLRVDASDDLGNWRTLVAQAPVVSLEMAGQRLTQKRVELPAGKVKYLRLAWVANPQDAPAPDITAARGELAAQSVEAAREWLTVEPRRGTKPGEYEFDLGGWHPVDRVRLQLPEPNTLAPVEWLVRNNADQPWRPVASGVVYRLRRGDTEVTSPELGVPAATERYWLLRVDQRGGGVGAAMPKLDAGWVPHQLVFAARGASPFQLAYGNREAKPAALAIETLIPGYREASGAAIRAAKAGAQQTVNVKSVQALAPAELGGAARREETVDWKRWSLWGALVLGVLVLGVMAWRLMKQMGSPAGPTAAQDAPRKDA